MHFFRVQEPGLTIEQMRGHTSADGGDGMEESGGLCACDSVSSMLRNTAMDASNEDDEIVVFVGRIVTEIYDGYRVIPTAEIARFTVAGFKAQAHEIACKYEKW